MFCRQCVAEFQYSLSAMTVDKAQDSIAPAWPPVLIAAVVQSFQAFPVGPEPFAFLRAVQPVPPTYECIDIGRDIFYMEDKVGEA